MDVSIVDVLMEPRFWFIVLLLATCESVVYQLMKWGDLRAGVLAAYTGNAVSIPVGFVVLTLLGPTLPAFIVAIAVSIAIDGGVMHAFNQEHPRYTALAVLLGNAVSYGVLAGLVYAFLVDHTPPPVGDVQVVP